MDVHVSLNTGCSTLELENHFYNSQNTPITSKGNSIYNPTPRYKSHCTLYFSFLDNFTLGFSLILSPLSLTLLINFDFTLPNQFLQYPHNLSPLSLIQIPISLDFFFFPIFSAFFSHIGPVVTYYIYIHNICIYSQPKKSGHSYHSSLQNFPQQF